MGRKRVFDYLSPFWAAATRFPQLKEGQFPTGAACWCPLCAGIIHVTSSLGAALSERPGGVLLPGCTH